MPEDASKRFQSGREVLQHFVPGYEEVTSPDSFPPSHDLIEDDGLRLAEDLLSALKSDLQRAVLNDTA